jgi:hypothetical protein
MMQVGDERRSSASSPVRLLGVLTAVATAALLVLLFTGFCFGRLSYVSDAEFIDRALVYQAPRIKGLDGGATRERILEYVKSNPTCCRVEGSAFFLNNSFGARLLGVKTTWVRIVHELTAAQLAVGQGSETFYEAYIGLSRCGQVVDHTGTRITESAARGQ